MLAGREHRMYPSFFEGTVPRAGILVLAATLALAEADPLAAKDAKRPVAGPLITIHAPHPEQLELALDEVELDWSGARGVKGSAPAALAVEIAGTRLVRREAVRAVVEVSGVADRQHLAMLAAALKAANPGAEAHLVVYQPGLPRGTASRRLLTREVGLLLEPGEEGRVLAGLAVDAVRAVPGVPGGYVVDAGEPLATVDLADALRTRPGVRSAHPILKRAVFPR